MALSAGRRKQKEEAKENAKKKSAAKQAGTAAKSGASYKQGNVKNLTNTVQNLSGTKKSTTVKQDDKTNNKSTAKTAGKTSNKVSGSNKNSNKVSTKTAAGTQKTVQSAAKSGAAYKQGNVKNLADTTQSLTGLKRTGGRSAQTATPSTTKATNTRTTESGRKSGSLSGGNTVKATDRRERAAQTYKTDTDTLNRNSILWHQTDDETEKARLKAENDKIRARRGLTFDSSTGRTMKGTTNLSKAVEQYAGNAPAAETYDTYEQKQARYNELGDEIERLKSQYPYLLAKETGDRKGDAALYFLTHPTKVSKAMQGSTQYAKMSDSEKKNADAMYNYYQQLVNEKNALAAQGGTLKNLAGAAGTTVTNAFGSLENASRYISSSAASATGAAAEALGAKNYADYMKDASKIILENSYTDSVAQKINEWSQPVGMAKDAQELAGSGARMLTGMAANAFVPGAGLAAIYADAAKSGAKEALMDGATLEQAQAYGIGSGAIEVGTEKLFGGIPGLNEGIAKLGTGALGKTVDIAGEGAEEAISTFLNPYLKRATYDKNAQNATAAELWDSAKGGMVLSGIMQGGNAIAGRLADRSVNKNINPQLTRPTAAQQNANRVTAAQAALDPTLNAQQTANPAQVQQNAQQSIVPQLVRADGTAANAQQVGQNGQVGAQNGVISSQDLRTQAQTMRQRAEQAANQTQRENLLAAAEQLETAAQQAEQTVQSEALPDVSPQELRQLAQNMMQRAQTAPDAETAANYEANAQQLVQTADQIERAQNPRGTQGKNDITPKLTRASAEEENSKAHTGKLLDAMRTNKAAIDAGGVLVQLDGSEFARSDKRLGDQVADFFASLGNTVTRSGLGDIALTKRGAKDSIMHGMSREKAIAFRAVPNVIQNGAVIDGQTNWKGRGWDSITFGGKIQIQGKNYNMGVIVRKYGNESSNYGRYYLHEVLLTDENGVTVPINARTLSGNPSDTVTPSSTDSVTQNDGFVNGTTEQALEPEKPTLTQKQKNKMLKSAKDGTIRNITYQQFKKMVGKENTGKYAVEAMQDGLFDVYHGLEKDLMRGDVQKAYETAAKKLNETIAPVIEEALEEDSESMMDLKKEIRQDLRTRDIDISDIKDEIKHKYGSVGSFLKRYRGKLNLVNNDRKGRGSARWKNDGLKALSADGHAQKLDGLYPEVFSFERDSIWNEADVFHKIVEVADWAWQDDMAPMFEDTEEATERLANRLIRAYTAQIDKAAGTSFSRQMEARITAQENARAEREQISNDISDAVSDALEKHPSDKNKTHFAFGEDKYYEFLDGMMGIYDDVVQSLKDDRVYEAFEDLYERTASLTGKFAKENANEINADILRNVVNLAIQKGQSEMQTETQQAGTQDITPKLTRPTAVDAAGQGATAESSVGAAEGGFDPYSRMVNDYGALPEGMNPARTVDVPQSTNGSDRVSLAARTFMESKLTPDELLPEFEQGVTEGLFSYQRKTDKASLDRAVNKINRDGYQSAFNQWQEIVNGDRTATKDDIVLAEMLYTAAAQEGDAQTAMELAAQIAAEGTIAGQKVQAFALLKRATPEGKLYYMQKAVQKLNQEYSRQIEKQNAKAEKKATKKAEKNGTQNNTMASDSATIPGAETADQGGIKLNEELVQRFMNATDEQTRNAIQEEIYQDIANQLPKTPEAVLNAWRYFAMLGNPRTHIRNIMGNVAYQIPLAISNKTSALMQLTRPEAERTRSLATSREAKAFAKQDYQYAKDELFGNAYTSEQNEIKRRQKVLPGILQKASDVNTWALNAEDQVFKKLTYVNSLANFITARGWDVNTMTAEQLNEARTHAKQDALRATFQDASALADAIGKIENKNKATKLVVGGLLPFKRTPINITKRAFELSPAGLIKALTYDAVQVKNGNMTATDMVDHVSQGLTGTTLAMLGAFLAANGLFSAGESDDDKEANMEAAMGKQEYALNIGGYSYTIDWSAPAVIPLAIGAELYEAMSRQYEDEESVYNQATDALSRMFEPLLNMTMLSGVSSTLQSAAYGAENALFAVGNNIAQNYVGQVVPTALGQVARTVDNTRRTTYADKNSAVPSSVQKFLQRQANKIPGLTKNQPAYTNVWGEEQKNGSDNVALRALYNFFSPGYLQKADETGVESALLDLYNQTGDNAALPSKPQKSYKNGDKTAYLSAEQYSKLTSESGTAAKEALNNLISSDLYQSMSNAEKLDTVSDIYSYAKALAANKVYGKELTSTQQSVKDSGIDAGIYYAYRNMEDTLSESMEGFEARDEVYQSIKNDTALSDKEKNSLYNALLIKGVSDSQWEKYQKISGKVTSEEYADALIQSQAIKSAGEDMEKGAAGAMATEFSMWLDSKGYSDEKREALESTFKFYSMTRASAESYTYDMLKENGSAKEKDYAGELENSGVTAAQYQKIKDAASAAEYTKGETGAKLKAYAAVVSANTTSYSQYAAVMHMLGYKNINKYYTSGGTLPEDSYETGLNVKRK